MVGEPAVVADSRYRRVMRRAAVPGFAPSVNGFRFANRWPAGPAFELRLPYLRIGVGEVADGLCGGMGFAAADRFLRGDPIPPDAAPPPPGSPLFREIARRQLDSFDRLGQVPLRFWSTAARVALGRWTARDQGREWRQIMVDIDGGRPAMVGLVRSAGLGPSALRANHQVVGYAYEASARDAVLSLYDPNHPGSDDVTVRLALTRVSPAAAGRGAAASDRDAPRFSLAQSTGEPLLALLRLPYRPAPRRS